MIKCKICESINTMMEVDEHYLIIKCKNCGTGFAIEVADIYNTLIIVNEEDIDVIRG